ncbi:hypothetical protein [Paracoccus niistensis]|uniref:Uncharacterized protein n=1 Tax=Paracoccus niistensis TaxID=632935 RepID=A0ABV6I834_9RHOB
MNEVTERLRRMTEGRDPAALVGLAASAAWVALVLLFWLLGPEGSPASGLGRLLALAGVILPLALIWIAVGLARAIEELRTEAALLRARMDMLRGSGREDEPEALGVRPAAEPRPRAEPRPPAQARPAAARAPATRPAAPRPSDLPPEPPPPPVQAEPATLIIALNFPDGPDDHEVISALRTALADPEAAKVIRAAQDIVTLLAQQGVYTDDLRASVASATPWRRFIAGQRGPALADLAAADPDSAEVIARAMRADEVFRDAAQHFMRQFDRTLARSADELGDEGILALASTRSGRAFALLAQVMGMFG